MLYTNNNSKNKTGDQDPFDKKKLAEEAKRDQEKIRAEQKEQEKRKLQLQIDNLERELDRLKIFLNTKNRLLSDAKRKVEDVKKAIFLLESGIKKQEGGMGYLNDDALAEENKKAATEAELNKVRIKIQVAEREKAALEVKVAGNKTSLNALNRKIDLARGELTKKLVEEETIKKDLKKSEDEVARKKSNKTRLEKYQGIENGENNQTVLIKRREADDLDREGQQLIREIDIYKRELEKLTAGLRLKEKMLADLKIKIDQARSVVSTLEEKYSGQGNDSSPKEEIALEPGYYESKNKLGEIEVDINRLKDKLRVAVEELELLKKEDEAKAEEAARKTRELDDLQETYQSLGTEVKQKTNKEIKVIKSIKDEERGVKKEKQELFLRKREIEQLTSDFNVLAQDVVNVNRDLASKEREIQDLKRKKDTIR